jgi:2,4'-dihydroxyacetophenone dioxygenase
MTSVANRKPDEEAVPYQHPHPPDMAADIVHAGVKQFIR